MRAVFRRRAFEERLRDELQLHLELLSEGNMRKGMSGEEARRRARISLGGFDQVAEEYRDAYGFRIISDLAQDTRYALRLLRRSPGFTLVSILSLALGIGANTAIFSVINVVLLRPLPYRDSERLVTLWESNRQQGVSRSDVSPANFVDWGAQSQSLEQAAAFRYWGFVLTGQGEPLRALGARVSANLAPLLGIKAVLGRTFLPDEDRFGGHRVVLLSHGFWQRQFGADPNIIGQVLMLNGDLYSIIGILPPRLQLPSAELWVPLALEPYAMTQRGNRSLTVLARLKSRVTLAQAQAEMDMIIRGLRQGRADAEASWGVTLVPLQQQLVQRIRPTLLMLLGAVGAVLLIACANMTNLLLGRAAGRRHEMALRTALGADRSRLIRQLLIESLLLALVSGVVGLVLGVWGTDLLILHSPVEVPRASEIGLGRAVLLFALLLSFGTGVGFGLLPALHGSGMDLNASLRVGRNGVVEGLGGNRLRNLAVIFEVASAVVLLTVAGLMLRSLFRLQEVELGFHPENVLTMTISLPEPQYADSHRKTAFYAQLLEQVKVLPGVAAAGLVSHLPLAGPPLSADFSVEERPLPFAAEMSVDLVAVSPDFFHVLGIPLLKGRLFSERDREGAPPVVIINEVLAHQAWPEDQPLGNHLRLGGTIGASQTPREVIGVVGSVRSAGLETEPRPAVYVPLSQNPWPTMSVVVRTTADPLDLAAPVRRQILAIDPNQPVYRVRTMEQVRETLLAPRQFQLFLLAAYACVALALAATGVYGVMSNAVTLRTHEIGVRMALGARPSDVVRLVVGRGMVLAGLGAVVGLAGAAMLTQLLAGQLYDVPPIDPLTFAGVTGVLVVAALAACYFPAYRAAKVDPLLALRAE